MLYGRTAPDHPRVCGEKQSSNPDMYPAHGSPPRVRGEAVYPRSCSRTGRITPACAGRSRKRAARGLAGPDHPRVRGEKFMVAKKRDFVNGSPPRARGEVAQSQREEKIKRITPVCAGRSFTLLWVRKQSTDHPRVRGEKAGCSIDVYRHEGSPPRARGEVIRPFSGRCRPRITPACAGRRKRRV